MREVTGYPVTSHKCRLVTLLTERICQCGSVCVTTGEGRCEQTTVSRTSLLGYLFTDTSGRRDFQRISLKSLTGKLPFSLRSFSDK